MKKFLKTLVLVMILTMTLTAIYLVGCASRERCPITRSLIASILVSGSLDGSE